MADFRFAIDLPVTSQWENVDLLRSSVQSCFTAVFRNVDGCHAITMVTGELLENAVKYGAWAVVPGSFRLRVDGSEHVASVTVENPITRQDKNVGRLEETIRWVNGFADAGQAYRARLLQVAETPRDVSASGIGLVRAAYEGNCTLNAEVTDDAVRVVARLTF
jgi:hypothetical protein